MQKKLILKMTLQMIQISDNGNRGSLGWPPNSSETAFKLKIILI
jgi:hypothetical protein